MINNLEECSTCCFSQYDSTKERFYCTIKLPVFMDVWKVNERYVEASDYCDLWCDSVDMSEENPDEPTQA